MKVAIIKYNAGNVQSVLYALQRLGVNAVVTGDHKEIKAADKVIFPGVGNAAPAMEYLKEHGLDKLIPTLKQPVLGICLGLQLLGKHTEEGDIDCMGVFDTNIKYFRNTGKVKQKIPQIGWNELYDLSSPLFEGVPGHSFVYFVHGYFAELCDATCGRANHIISYSAALQKDNFYAVQFHTEKSGPVGQRILSNFINL